MRSKERALFVIATVFVLSGISSASFLNSIISAGKTAGCFMVCKNHGISLTQGLKNAVNSAKTAATTAIRHTIRQAKGTVSGLLNSSRRTHMMRRRSAASNVAMRNSRRRRVLRVSRARLPRRARRRSRSRVPRTRRSAKRRIPRGLRALRRSRRKLRFTTGRRLAQVHPRPKKLKRRQSTGFKAGRRMRVIDGQLSSFPRVLIPKWEHIKVREPFRWQYTGRRLRRRRVASGARASWARMMASMHKTRQGRRMLRMVKKYNRRYGKKYGPLRWGSLRLRRGRSDWGFFSSIAHFAKSAWHKVKSGIKKAYKSVHGVVKGIKNGISNAIKKAKKVFNKVAKGIKKGVATVGAFVKKVGKVAKGIYSKVSHFVSKYVNIKAIGNLIKKVAGKVGAFMMKAFGVDRICFKNCRDASLKAIGSCLLKNAGAEIKKAFEGALTGGIFGGLAALGRSVLTSLKRCFSSKVNPACVRQRRIEDAKIRGRIKSYSNSGTAALSQNSIARSTPGYNTYAKGSVGGGAAPSKSFVKELNTDIKRDIKEDLKSLLPEALRAAKGSQSVGAGGRKGRRGYGAGAGGQRGRRGYGAGGQRSGRTRVLQRTGKKRREEKLMDKIRKASKWSTRRRNARKGLRGRTSSLTRSSLGGRALMPHQKRNSSMGRQLKRTRSRKAVLRKHRKKAERAKKLASARGSRNTPLKRAKKRLAHKRMLRSKKRFRRSRRSSKSRKRRSRRTQRSLSARKHSDRKLSKPAKKAFWDKI